MSSFAPLTSAETIAYTIVIHLASALSAVGGAAAAIVLCTVAVRLALVPLTLRAVRAERTRARLAPRVAELRRRYARRPERMAEELAALYRAERTSPLAGYLPSLLQMPVFLLLYRLFYAGSIGGHGNGLLAQGLFGVPLGTRLLSGPVPAQGVWVYAALFVVLAVIAAAGAHRAYQVARATGGPTGGPAAWLARLVPFASLATAAFVPLAGGLYLVATTAFTAVESRVLCRGMPPR